MEELKKLILEVLEKAYLMNLATVDEAGPWVSTVIVVHDQDMNLYWLSLPNRRHSLAIEKNPRAAATITLAFKKGDEKIGLQVQGRAMKCDRVDDAVVSLYTERYGKPTIDGQIFASGQVWYKLCPTKIDLIHQPLFGHEKKFLEF